MGQLVYWMNVSLDGYVADEYGDFGSWSPPDEQVLTAITEELAGMSTYLYGRRLYELMAVWETDPEIIEHSAQNAEFARIWQSAEKVVYSRTLTRTHTERTRLRARFDPAEVELLKAEAPGDLAIEGPTLAAEAFRHQLVDAVVVFLCPVVLGGGHRFWPERRLNLSLRHQRRFDSGTIQLRYDVLAR